MLAFDGNTPVRFTYEFGDSKVHLCGANQTIVSRISEAFEHLRSESDESPQLEIRLFSSSKNKVKDGFLNAADWSCSFEGGTVSGTADSRYLTYSREWSEQQLDRNRVQILAWYDEHMEIPYAERSKPLSLPLTVWYNDRGIQIVHAGLLSLNETGILIAGPAGSGKTTVALACTSEGYRFLADDYAGVQQQADGSFAGFSLYNSIRLDRSGLDYFRRFRSYAEMDPDGKEKSILFLNRIFPQLVARRTRIGIVLFPKISDSGETRVRPIEKGKALLRFAYSSIQIPSSGPAFGLGPLSRLLEKVPCFWLELGRDISEIPMCVSNLLSEVTA
jgi:hypothetical protein